MDWCTSITSELTAIMIRGRLFPLLGRFGQIAELMGTDKPCFDGMVMDIGVSSGQVKIIMRLVLRKY